VNISEENGKGSGQSVCGKYVRVQCRAPFNQGAAWIRQGMRRLYLLIQPNVSSTGPDTAIISRSLSHKEASFVVARFPEMWQPNDALVKTRQIVKNAKLCKWDTLDSLHCLVPTTNIEVTSQNEKAKSDELLNIEGLTPADCEMLALRASHNGGANQILLQMSTGQKTQQTVRAFNAICVSKILQFAASHGVGYDLRSEAEWKTILPSKESQHFGTCPKSFPQPPLENVCRAKGVDGRQGFLESSNQCRPLRWSQ